MITDEMKLTRNYRMHAVVFGVDVPTTQSQPTESTQGTHRTTSAHRTPNPSVDKGESIEEHLIADEIEKLVEGTKNAENDEVDSTTLRKNDNPNDLGTRLELRSNKESSKVEITTEVQPVNINEEEEESSHDDYQLKSREKRKHTRFTPRKKFNVLAQHLQEIMEESLPKMVDDQVKELTKTHVLDDPHDDAHPEGKNDAKRQKTSEHATYVFGESSSSQDNESEPDDDELPTEKVSQELMNEMSQTVDEAKLRKVVNKLLRQRCTSGDEHQYYIDQMQNFLKNDIVWESKKEILNYWELGHEHKFITEIIARRENGSIVSITESDYKNLNKNDIEDMYLLIVNSKLGVESYQQKVNLTAPTITFPCIKKYKVFSIVSKSVLEGLKSYNNDVKHGYVTLSLSKEDAEYLQLFKEEIDEWLKHQDQMRRRAAAIDQPWEDFKKLLIEEYCPDDEIQKLEYQLWNHKMLRSDVDSMPVNIQSMQSVTPITPATVLCMEDVCKWVTLPDSAQAELLMKDQDQLVTSVETLITFERIVQGNKENQTRARAFIIGAAKALHDPNNVTGTFSLNDHFATILFDSGVDYSCISTKFLPLINMKASFIHPGYEIEIVNGLKVETNKIIRGCRLELEGRGLKWLFDIDSLTKSMNYEPVTAGNQTYDDAGIEINVNAGQVRHEKASDHEYILLPFTPSHSPLSSSIQSTDDKDADKAPGKGDKGVSKGSEIDNQESMPSLEETSMFDDVYDDREVDTEADTKNLELSIVVSLIPTTRVHNDHPKYQIIGDLNIATQTKRICLIFLKKMLWLASLTSREEQIIKIIRTVYFPVFSLNKNPKRAIETKWVFRNKKDEKGIVVRNKVRLVAQGYTQEEGLNYDEVFAPVARIEAIRLFFAYASFMRFIVYQMDVKSTFLYGTIEDEVYVLQLLGFKDPYFPNKVKQKDDGIFISQDKYVDDILKKYDFTTVKTACTLMEPNKALIKDAEAEDVKTINEDVQLQALVDGKKVIVNEASIRRDLKLDDAEGTTCLPNAAIFEELERMSTMASAIICLANNQKFNFSKYILDNMVKNLEAGVKFYMFPRYVQVFMNHQLGDMSHHKGIFANPSLTKKKWVKYQQILKTHPFLLNNHPLNPKGSTNQKRKQRKEIEVSQDVPPTEEHIPTHSHDPLPSGEDRLQLNELMEICTKLSDGILSLRQIKTNQTAKNKKLKKRVKNLKGKKKKRTHGLKRLYKGWSIADINQDKGITLIDDTQGRINEEELFGVNNLDGDDVVLDVSAREKEEQSKKVVEKEDSTADPVTTAGEVVTTTNVEVSASLTTITTTDDELTLAQTLIEIKAAKLKALPTDVTIVTVVSTRPKEKGIIMQEPSEIPSLKPIVFSQQPSQPKDKGKAKMVKPERPLKRKEQIMMDEQSARDLEAQMQADLEKELRIAKQKEKRSQHSYDC
nr:putative ribonuclease H-like domain-containing protein [Tanacetum cinerariifolium]